MSTYLPSAYCRACQSGRCEDCTRPSFGCVCCSGNDDGDE